MKTVSSFPPTAAAARILLADDHKLGLAARKSLLQDQGYEIVTANDGEEAYEAFRSGRFDLVITDYKMPGMNGVNLIAEIRKLAPEVPLILISGYADALGLDEESTGADAVIPKNANEVAHLLRTVSRLLRRPGRKPVRSQGARGRAAAHSSGK